MKKNDFWVSITNKNENETELDISRYLGRVATPDLMAEIRHEMMIHQKNDVLVINQCNLDWSLEKLHEEKIYPEKDIYFEKEIAALRANPTRVFIYQYSRGEK